MAQGGKKGRSCKPAARAITKSVLSERQRTISNLVLDAVPQYEIAEQLKLHPSVISKEMKRVRAAWRAETVATYDQYLRKELAKLERDERSIRKRLEAPGLEDRDWAKLHELLLKISDRRSKLLGLDAPVKVEAKVASVAVPVSIDGDPEAERMARELSARVYGPKPEPVKTITVEGGIVHRDLKPENVHLNGNGQANWNGTSHA